MALLTLLISSQVDVFDAYSLQSDSEGTTWPPRSDLATPLYSGPTSPGSVDSDLAAFIDVSTLSGGLDPEPEIELPFSSKRISWPLEYVFMHDTPLQGPYICSRRCVSQPVEDGNHRAPGGEKQEEEVSSASTSAESVVATLWYPGVY